MLSRIAALLVSLSLCAGLLTGCGLKVQYWRKPPARSDSSSSSAASDGSQDDSSAGSSSPDDSSGSSSSAGVSSSGRLVDYLVDDIGVFSLPEGFETSTGTQEDRPIPFVAFTRGELRIQVSRFGPEVFEAAGSSMPATVEEYSRDPGALDALPEGSSYQEDAYGNYSAAWTEDGRGHLLILMKGATSFASAYAEFPEGSEEAQSIPLWMSLSAVD